MSDPTPEAAPLIPVEERAIEFYEDNLTAVAVEVEGQRKIFVPIKPITEYLGVDWSAQRQRVMRDEVLAGAVQGVVITTIPSPSGVGGGPQEMLCLPIEMMHGWLFGLQASRVRPELREKVLRYQRDCYRVLFEAFQAKAIENAEEDIGAQIMAPVQTEPSAQLLQIREMGLAIVRMAEQQLALENRVSTTETRLDRAALFFTDLNRRLSTVERRITPASHITEEQAAEVSALVKALAELLTGKGRGNAYQGVFSELYRRFGVSSYHHIRQDQYDAVLRFLSEWGEASTREEQ